MDRQAIVVAGPVGSGAVTFARDLARRIGGLRRHCTWSDFVAPYGPRALRDHPAVLVVDGMPDSHVARDVAADRLALVEPQLIFVSRSAATLAGDHLFAVVEVERQAPVSRKPEAGSRKDCPRLQARNHAGVACAFELTLRFIAWANSMQNEPTAQQIRDRWEVSRATSYRWLRAWQDAKGVLL